MKQVWPQLLYTFLDKWREVKVTHVSDSLWPHRLYSSWNSPGLHTGESSLSLLQKIFPTQGLNPGHPHCRQILYQLNHKGNPRILSLLWRIFLTQELNRGLLHCWWIWGKPRCLIGLTHITENSIEKWLTQRKRGKVEKNKTERLEQ